MDRSDFIQRGELKVDFLKYYLDPIKFFTIQDFKDGTFYYSWDKMRFYRLQKEGWLTKKGNDLLSEYIKF